MKVRKFCRCGTKLERDGVADEDAARVLVEAFWRAHSGYEHGPATYQQYLQAVSKIVARNARSNRPREVRPLLAEISRAESMPNDHRWTAGPGVEFCAVCLIIRRPGAHAVCCTG